MIGRWRTTLALAAGGLAVPLHALPAERFRCDLPEGGIVVVAQDLSATFPGSVPRCRRIAALEPATGVAEPAIPAWRRFLDDAAAGAVPSVRRSPPNGSSPARDDLSSSTPFHSLIRAASRRYNVDAALVAAVITVESRFHPEARSAKGALGLMQVMPATGARYGVHSAGDLLDPGVNIDIGTRYLLDLQNQFGHRMPLVIAAYNAGEGSVLRYGNRVPPYPETQSYVAKVLSTWREWTDLL
jgi:soluble lytic murein transglycosylase-like protein